MTGTQVALVVKNLPSRAEEVRDMGSIPGGGHDSPLQHSSMENPTDRGIWRARVYGVAKSQTPLKHRTLFMLDRQSQGGEK